MKIELYFENEKSTNENDFYVKKTFTAPFIPLLVVKEFTKMRAESENELAHFSDKELEKVIDLVCMTFRRQFTSDDFYRGMPTDAVSAFLTAFHNKAFNISDEPTGEVSTGKK
ncbi:hypothetical protein V7100_03890 [Priestia megaterium]|uniref:phage tail assembly chaperone G n=1 Tax=Priestia megaterium TaxID=1404 RepID=UPI00300086ED